MTPEQYVTLRDAISAHIEHEAKRSGTYHGDPAATPGGTGYCIPAAVATGIVDKYLLDFRAAPRAEGRPSEAEDWYELDRRILASEQRIVLLEAVIREAVAHIEGFMANGPQQPAGGWYGAQSWLAELPSRLRPSDERVPESEECKRFRHDEHCEH